ncbi:hypothetical protein [Methylobacterium planeticum]|uniref:Uncharacterized protein n=1 Tax=Methylobacterium planeticum TaxID=2615211 RepID=A0A6N6MWC1_9HYPH|nr:hypothetical protein [Methylobacterium planeticum]KAB1075079.1 hypothetical protein F6X51_04085 [Methylobacterium planeticum]
MSSDQVAKLAATIEVLTSAVQFLVAERLNDQPPEMRPELLRVLQRAFSAPPKRDEPPMGRPALTQADLALWMPIVAQRLMDDVRVQLGLPPESVAHIGGNGSLGPTDPAR